MNLNFDDQLRAITRRQKVMRFTPAIMLTFSGTFTIVENDLPDDAETVGAFYDDKRNTFSIVVESNEFEPVSLLDELPLLPPPTIQTRFPLVVEVWSHTDGDWIDIYVSGRKVYGGHSIGPLKLLELLQRERFSELETRFIEWSDSDDGGLYPPGIGEAL